MYAIVDIAGQQFKVQKDQKIFVHRLQGSAGDKVEFDKVLLLDKEGTVVVGTPSVEGAKVIAKILEHVKGEKEIVFKKKRRKGYAVKNGHRQFLTQIEIQAVLGKGDKDTELETPKKKAKAKKEKAEVSAEETQVKKSTTKKKTSKKSSTEEKE